MNTAIRAATMMRWQEAVARSGFAAASAACWIADPCCWLVDLGAVLTETEKLLQGSSPLAQ